MRVSRVLLILSIALASSGAPAEEIPVGSVEKCGVIFENSSGEPEHKLLPGLAVLAIADGDAFALPPDAPPKVMAVQCGRTTLVPHKNDYQVLLAGFPFSIASDDRVGILEVVEGHVQFRMLDGKMTDAELEPIGKYLDFAQGEIAKKG